MYKVLKAILVCIFAIVVIEFSLRHWLFQYTSYSNSESIDAQIRERDSDNNWDIIFIGDSETHWGINPEVVDRVYLEKSLSIKSFNHAFDGFGSPWWLNILPPLLHSPSLSHVKAIVLGVQLIDSNGLVKIDPKKGCGALQKPVLTSPFGVDLGLNSICLNESWDTKIGKKIFGDLWIVKYVSSVRQLIMPTFLQNESGRLKTNSRSEVGRYRGFEPHKNIASNIDECISEFARWKAKYDSAKDFAPLASEVWPNLVSDGGLFDGLNKVMRHRGIKLVLFALPTNPIVIDIFNRRNDYKRNSKLLSDWAKLHDVIFIDLGIQDRLDANIYFSDIRHLSGFGANEFSKKLADEMFDQGVLIDR